MANYVTYYNGQRVEITQETLQAFLAGNPGDIGRVGSAFAGDDANLARSVQADHPASVAVSTPSAGYAAPAYAQPSTVTQAGSTGDIVSATASDGLLTGTGAIGATQYQGSYQFGGVNTPVTNGPVALSSGSLPSGIGSIPVWVWIGVAVAIVFAMRR